MLLLQYSTNMPPNLPTPRPPLQTRLPNVVHPSVSYGHPYAPEFRAMVMQIQRTDDIDPAVTNFLNALSAQHLYPSQQTVDRWAGTEQDLGHYRACRRSGNKFASRLRGDDLILLALYRLIYPKAQASEINAFLYRANYGDPNFRFYNPSCITQNEQRIGLTRKAGSTTAYQALFPHNIRKRWCYWNLPYPMGIADCERRFMIDLDECGIFVETANRKHGKAYLGHRVKEPGPYSKSEKWNLLLAICGEDGIIGAPSQRWKMTWLDGGTTVDKMLQFIQEILQDIGHATPNNIYCFTMDNLNSHTNVGVVALIYAYGHRVAFRAPYYPVDGAIEYVFNSVQNLLRCRLYEVTDGPSLIRVVNECIQSITDFAPYFTNVGFIRP